MATPDFDLFENVIRRKVIPYKVPLYEHFADDEIIEKVMGYDFSVFAPSSFDDNVEKNGMRIEFYRQMGYDFYPYETSPKFAQTDKLSTKDTAVYSRGERAWINEHGGPIQTIEDVEDDANWPTGEGLYDYKLFEAIGNMLPTGMKIVGAASGGPFEHATFLMGTESLFINLYEDEELMERLFERIGKGLIEVASRLVQSDKLGILRFGDDLGYKTSTMVSPKLLRKYVFPWSKRVAEVAHNAGKPFILHSCGQLKDIMDDLIDYVGIDAKHSFEDTIITVQEAKKLWGDRIALLGGIDVDFICRASVYDIKERTKRTLEYCSVGGGYAMGTGNTVANYVPVQNYLAMLEATREFNGIS